MTTKLQIVSAVMLCLSAFLVIQKVADATASLQYLPNYNPKHPVGGTTIYVGENNKVSVETFVPPNNGGPDSEYGSGTR
ncbi:hypothetical protein [Nostoc sp. CMAA1605]|uniref:hypothetical protein n=1 Tax=Nostoc sp. CMAA1605 TaxID=2055159 RepID=UPI001F3EF6AC|nr:hypothetical protein [Nostoc sp. CMAA1605]MCF4968000.1 hypothetical protein [Nostoc sp. CMAA1605]